MEKRLDIAIREKMNVSRDYAKEIIKAGKCSINGKIIYKPSTIINSESKLLINAEKPQYVSRGGKKLEYAIKKFKINLNDAKCLDIGASTGGFTDCMLQNGAKYVIALENGHSQLDKKLLENPKVISLEKTDIRNITENFLSYKPDFVSVDLSFISLKLVIPSIASLMSAGSKAVFLLKPQFECGPGNVNKKGIITDLATHQKVFLQALETLALNSFNICGAAFSPILGGDGNIEYLIYVVKE